MLIGLTVMIAIPVGLYTAIRDPFVQTFVARSAAAYLSNQWETEVGIKGFYIDLDLSLTIEEVFVNDQRGNRLLEVGAVKMDLLSAGFRNALNINKLSMRQLVFQLIVYEGEEDMNLQFIIDYFSGDRTADTLQTDALVYPVSLAKFSLEDASFRYWDQNKHSPGEAGMDYAHINITDIVLDITDFQMNGYTMSGTIGQMALNDTSGLEVKQFKGKLALSPDSLRISDLKTVINNSTLNLDLAMTYDGFPAFLDFIDAVQMDITAHPSRLYMADIGYFAPIMFDMANQISFAGGFKGTVSDLRGNGVSFSYGQSTLFAGDISMKGLPDIYDTRAMLLIRKLETSVTDLEGFALAGDMRHIPITDEVRRLGKVRINGLFDGVYNDFIARATFNTSIGKLVTDLQLKHDVKSNEQYYKGKLEASKFNLGYLINTPKTIGTLDMNVVVDGKGLSTETAEVILDGALQRIEFLGNQFRDIKLTGELSGKAFNGRMEVNDSKLKFNFLGSASFAEAIPGFNFEARVQHADLYKLNLLDQDTLMHLSTEVDVNFSGLNLDELVGSIYIGKTQYQDSRGSYSMEAFNLQTSHDALYPRRLTIDSDFLDLDMGGKIDFANLDDAFKHYVGNYIKFRSFDPLWDTVAHQDFFIDIHFRDTETLSSLFMPAISLHEGSRFSGVFTSRDQVLNTTFRTNQLAFNAQKVNNLVINTNSNRWQAELQLRASDIVFRDSTERQPQALGLVGPEFQLLLADDSLRFRLQWSDQDMVVRNRGDISGYYAALTDRAHELKITSADLVVNDSVWRIGRGNRILFTEDYTFIDNLHVRTGDQSISLQGNVPLNESDSLDIKFVNWNISNFDLLMAGTGIDLDGNISGELVLSNLLHQPTFVSNLHITALHMNRERLGDARILTTWNNIDESLYVNAQLINIGNVSTSRMLGLRGFYYPTRQDNSLIMDLELENYRLRTLAPFMEGVLSRVEGLATGNVAITGTLQQPEVNGSLNLMRTAFLIDYLNVKYSLAHEFNIDKNRIDFDNLILYDTLGNKATVTGNITHDYFRDFRFNLLLKPDDFLALNTDRTMNDLFYGSAVVTGDVAITGEINDVGLNIKAISRRGTNITIPLTSSTTVYDNDFIVFLRDKDAEDEAVEERKPQVQGFDINIDATVTPDANLRIFLPDNMGNLEASGSGNLKMGATSAGDFSLLGEYVVRSGQFNFMFENLVRRRFDLMEGGRISWTGDPFDADVDIRGLYRLKTSIASLGPGIDSTMRSRINVEAVIHLTDQLFNPTIRFSIRLPNVDTETRQMVYSVLDTTNDAMMTQQILSLLVLGSFSYAGGESASLGASSISVISNQLSNWLSQISKDFDIGLHYKPGDRISNEELEVALSTQLFNDRVTIDGNFGVVGNRQTTNNASNIVGDVDISVMLTADGRLRMKAFNHSNTSVWFSSRAYENNAPYTQGVGFSYRQEFDRFGDLWRRKRKP